MKLKLFIMLSWCQIVTTSTVAIADPDELPPYVEGRVSLNEDERTFVKNLNRLRELEHEKPIDYFIYQIKTGERFRLPVDSRAEKMTKFATQKHLYIDRLYQLSKGRPIVLELFTGFSAAGYDVTLFKSDLSTYTRLAIANNKKLYGEETVTIFISGATQDGIGLIYDPEITGPDLLKTGIVSNQAIATHFKYGNTIAPGQDAILFVDSFSDPGGAKSWEVKTKSDASSLNDTIHDGLTSQITKQLLFEGGDISIKEALEWLTSRDSASYENRKFELNLFVGYRPSNTKKDKGYRAASQIAQLLLRCPQLVPNNVSVKIREAGQMDTVKTLEEFSKTKRARRLLDHQSISFVRYAEFKKAQIMADKEKSPGWYKRNQNDIEAQIRQLDAWLGFNSLVESTLTEVQHRNNLIRAHWAQAHKTNGAYSNVAQESEAAIVEKMRRLDQVIASLRAEIAGVSCSSALTH